MDSNRSVPAATPSAPTEPDQHADTAGAMVARLKQMGVSFIGRDELTGDSRLDDFEYNSVLPPRAAREVSHTESITSEASLAINSAAIRYLDDKQLTHMAKNNGAPIGAQRRSRPLLRYTHDPLTPYGLPESKLTASSRQFLIENRFVEGTPQADGGGRGGRRYPDDSNMFLRDILK